MIKLTIGERLKDERVNNNLTIQQVCDKLKEKYNFKLSVGKLNEMESDEDKDFGYRAFVYLSKLYKVSTDYLLGLTDIKTNDTTIQSICEYTGLSEIVTHNLMMWKEAKNDNRNVGFHNLETLNILFETPAFFLLLLYLRRLNYYSSEILKDADKNINEIDIGEMLGNDNDSDLCRYKVSEFINDIMNEKFDNRKIHNGTYHRVIDNFR